MKNRKMTKKQAEDILYQCDMNGFDYVFISYSDYEEIKDNKFQELKKAYVDASNALDAYLREICPDHI